MPMEALKERAALAALDEVRSGMSVGLGTGSTVAYFLKHLAAAIAEGRLEGVAGVPTSDRTESVCVQLHVPLTTLADHPRLDLAVDGADEVDPALDLIKGLGGALLREKMVAAAARRFVVIADESKQVRRLGERAPVPVEVIPFEWRWHLPFLTGLGARPLLRMDAAGGMVRTDNGNAVIDCHFKDGIPDPAGLARLLEGRPGVVGHGLFLGSCDRAVIATAQGVVVRDRAPRSR